MSQKVGAGYATPMLHVAAVERSIGFYRRLGFEVIDNDRCEPLGWARLHCQGGAIMLGRASAPVDPEAQGVLLYLYTPDLAGLRRELEAAGVDVSVVGYPEYMPRGELRLADPDGYTVLVGHWGEEEDTAWRRRIGAAGQDRDDDRGSGAET